MEEWITVDNFNIVRANKYNGEYQIQRGYRNDNGEYEKWAIDSEWKNSTRVAKTKPGCNVLQAFPVVIPLTHDHKLAIEIAEAIVAQLKALK